MTNYDERLDEIFAPLIDSPSLTLTTAYWDEAKAAITSLIKELVEEAKPAMAIISDEEMGIDRARKSAANNAIDQFEQNLLKALEEV